MFRVFVGLIATLMCLSTDGMARSNCQTDPTGFLTEVEEGLRNYLHDKYMVNGLNIDWSADELCAQAGVLTRDEILRIFKDIFSSWFEDGTDPNSPMALMIHLVYEENGWEPGDVPLERVISLAQTKLSDFLDWEDSRVEFWSREMPTLPYGESTAEYWVWYMRIPGLSDHGFWAMLHKNGSELPYNYGVN